jgi:hypothetical protein
MLIGLIEEGDPGLPAKDYVKAALVKLRNPLTLSQPLRPQLSGSLNGKLLSRQENRKQGGKSKPAQPA